MQLSTVGKHALSNFIATFFNNHLFKSSIIKGIESHCHFFFERKILDFCTSKTIVANRLQSGQADRSVGRECQAIVVDSCDCGIAQRCANVAPMCSHKQSGAIGTQEHAIVDLKSCIACCNLDFGKGFDGSKSSITYRSDSCRN
ncbi:Uncharacterised protein [Chlamydia trachomatis]|nr:Uncharacterised protein [Chlamydia trachomatis]